jgi:hypothetical protein
MYFQVRLEESVSQQHEQAKAEQCEESETVGTTPYRTRSHEMVLRTPGRATAESITQSSRADYTCYTLRNEEDYIVAIIIETKLRSHKKYKYAVAQVIGYYLSLMSEQKAPPLVFVLSDRDIQLVMFPFRDTTENVSLINAVRFIEVPLWSSEHPTNFNMSAFGILYLVLRIAIEDTFSKVGFLEYDYDDAVKKRTITNVTTFGNLLHEIENMRERMEERERVMRERMEEKERVMRERMEEKERVMREQMQRERKENARAMANLQKENARAMANFQKENARAMANVLEEVQRLKQELKSKK